MSIDKYIASCRRGEHPTLDEAEPEGDGERRCVECGRGETETRTSAGTGTATAVTGGSDTTPTRNLLRPWTTASSTTRNEADYEHHQQ